MIRVSIVCISALIAVHPNGKVWCPKQQKQYSINQIQDLGTCLAANLTTTVSEMTLYVGMRQRDLIFSVLIFSSDV